MTEIMGDRIRRARPLAELVYERLEEWIIDGTLASGQHLREETLADALGVSRNPIRECLRALERAGWITIRPGRGAFVRTPNVDEVLDFFHVRTVLEIESARLAARNAVPNDVALLEQILDEGNQALKAKEPDTLVALNLKFHGTVHMIAANQVLREMLQNLDRRLRWYFTPVVVSRSARSWAEHEELTRAFASNNEGHAAALMRAHVDATTEAYRASRRRATADDKLD